LVEQVLIVDPDDSVRGKLEATLGEFAESPVVFHQVPDAPKALAYLARHPVDAVLWDKSVVLGARPGEEARLSRDLAPGALVLTGRTDPGSLAEEARRRYAFDCLEKPIQKSRFLFVLDRVRERAKAMRKHRTLQLALDLGEGEGEHGIVAASDAMIDVLEQLERAAEFSTPALIVGEHGTRKKLFAEAIHAQSLRRAGAFIPVDCRKPGAKALDSLLPQRAHGAQGRGRSDLASLVHGGTLFLHNVDSLSLDLQASVIQLIQVGEISLNNPEETRRVDTRVLASTSRDLDECASSGTFDPKLLDLLAGLRVPIPPLRERRSDIPLLVDQFISAFGQDQGRAPGRLSQEALRRLCEYSWPGNVQELRNALERAVLLAPHSEINLAYLPHAIVEDQGVPLAESGESFALKPARQAFETRIIRRALAATGGNRTQTAKLLGISHRSLLYKLKNLNLQD